MDDPNNETRAGSSVPEATSVTSGVQTVSQETVGQRPVEEPVTEVPNPEGDARNAIEDAAEQSIAYSDSAHGAANPVQLSAPEKLDDPEAEPRAEFEIPEGLRRRFLVEGSLYHFRDPQNTVAFEDRGRNLVTQQDSADVAKSMVELAEAKGWTTLRMRGTEAFKRAAWLEASLRGLETAGFTPEAVDRQRLAELRREEERRHERAGERTEHRVPNRQQEAQHQPDQTRMDERPLSTNQSTAIQALRAVLRERGDTPEQISAAVDVARVRFSNRRAYVGAVLEHGAAPYEFDPDKERSYFVRLGTAQGERVVWGVDLARAIEEDKIQVGEAIALASGGKQPVTVKIKQRDGQGQVVGVTEITTNRNQWAAQKLEGLRAEALAVIAHNVKTTTKQPLVPTYDVAGETRNRTPRPTEADRERQAQRAR